MINYQKVHASDFFDDNNNGLVLGVEWWEGEYNDADVQVMWFKSEKERNDFIPTLNE